MNVNIRNNSTRNRFETTVNGHLAKVNYRLVGDDTIDLVHTEVPDELRGNGIASRLAEYALNYAKEHELRVLPHCPFIAAYVEKHPEYQSITEPVG